MAVAIIGTLMMYFGVSTTLKSAFIGMVLGSLIGVPLAMFMPMTAVPQRTALSHAFGALAAALVGTAHYYRITASKARSSHDGASWRSKCCSARSRSPAA